MWSLGILALSGCASDLEPADVVDVDAAETVSVDGAAGDVTPAAPDVPADEAPSDVCDLEALYELTVGTHVGRCRACHDATAPPGLLKAPGPPWLYPQSPALTINAIERRGLVDSVGWGASLFLLKPTGAVAHGGGQLLPVGSAGATDFETWVQAAAGCWR